MLKPGPWLRKVGYYENIASFLGYRCKDRGRGPYIRQQYYASRWDKRDIYTKGFYERCSCKYCMKQRVK